MGDAPGFLWYLLRTLEPLSFLHGGATPRCTARIDKVFEGYFTLQLMSRGGAELAYGGLRYRLEGAWFWPAYPGPRIRFNAAPGYSFWEHRYVAFRGAALAQWQAEGLWPLGPQRVPDGGDYPELFDALLEQTQRAASWGSRRAVNLLERILLELAEARTQAARPTWLAGVLQQLDRDGRFAPDYAGVAAACGVRLSTLRRFKRATGTTLHAYVVALRMAEAKHLLGEAGLSVVPVADRLGYADVYF